MSSAIVTVKPEMEIMEAVHLLSRENLSGAPVTDDVGQLVGILTERDCIDVALQAAYHGELGGDVAQFMTRNVKAVHPDMSIVDLARLFVETAFRRFPVVENGELAGLICRRDILRAMSQQSGTSR